jgi:hypothetical protein
MDELSTFLASRTPTLRLTIYDGDVLFLDFESYQYQKRLLLDLNRRIQQAVNDGLIDIMVIDHPEHHRRELLIVRTAQPDTPDAL